ncbi:MAG: hypothetical protein V1776_04340 [Candidatus Diapherotrites archaeon]
MSDKPGTGLSVRLGAGIIIALMLLSGVGIFFAGQSAQQDNQEDPLTNQSLDTFLVEDTEATITMVFPTAIIGGQTSETDKTVIDAAIQDIPFVAGITSQFTTIDSATSELAYLASVQLEEGFDKESFLAEVENVSSLSNHEIYFQASAQVPSTLTGTNQNGDTKSFTLQQTTIQAIVSSQTQSGDQVKSTVSATFQGETIVSVYLIETQNMTQSPISLSTNGEYTISSLQPRISITGEWKYIPQMDGNALQKLLSGIAGIEKVDSPIIPSLDNMLVAIFQDANIFIPHVKLYMVDHPDVFTDVQGNGNQLYVSLGNISLDEAKKILQSVVSGATATNSEMSFQDPLTRFLVEADTIEENVGSVSEKIVNTLNGMGIQSEVFQNGTMILTEVSFSDSNKSFIVPNEGIVSIVVKPGKNVGDVVFLNLNAVAMKGELTFISGIEVDPPLLPDETQI